MAVNQKHSILSNASISCLMPESDFRQAADQSTGCDLEFCKATEQSVYLSSASGRISDLRAEIAPAKVRTVGSATCAANTLMLFLNLLKAVHAASAWTAAPLTDRDMPPRLKLRKTLEKSQVAWRLTGYV